MSDKIRWKDKAKLTPADDMLIPVTPDDGSYIDGHVRTEELKEYFSPAAENTVYLAHTGGDVATVAALIAYLDTLGIGQTEGVAVLVGPGKHEIDVTAIIDYSFAVSITGISVTPPEFTVEDGLKAGDGLPMWAILSDCAFRHVNFVGDDTYKSKDNGSFIEMPEDPASSLIVVNDCEFEKGNRLICNKNNNEVRIGFCRMKDGGACGIGFDSDNAGGSVEVRDTYMEGVKVGLALLKGDGVDVYAEGLRLINSAGDIGIQYVPADFVNYTNFKVYNCSWNRIGSVFDGFDFSLARDANIEFVGNTGVPNNSPYAFYEVRDNATPTSCAASAAANLDNLYKAELNGASIQREVENKIEIDGNKLTWLTDFSTDGTITITGSVQVDQANRVIYLCIKRNNNPPGDITAPLGLIEVRAATAGQPYPFAISLFGQDAKAPDYVEIYVGTDGTNREVIVDNLQFTALGR
jgi:hypothetical protein